MSISDLIVVMKDGVLQQLGKPQHVYDSPANLFVARFLGTPPINVFHGRVSGGRVMLGDSAILRADVPDQEVYVAIRPEGFILDEQGPLSFQLRAVEIMGRDVSVVAAHPAMEGEQIRAIIPSTARVDDEAASVRFSLHPEKVLLFSKADEMRIDAHLA